MCCYMWYSTYIYTSNTIGSDSRISLEIFLGIKICKSGGIKPDCTCICHSCCGFVSTSGSAKSRVVCTRLYNNPVDWQGHLRAVRNQQPYGTVS